MELIISQLYFLLQVSYIRIINSDETIIMRFTNSQSAIQVSLLRYNSRAAASRKIPALSY